MFTIPAFIVREGGDKPPFIVRFEKSDVRLILAVTFALLFVGTIIAALAMTFRAPDPAKTWITMKDVLAVLLPAETGILGSMLGFYFGTQAVEDRQPAFTLQRADGTPITEGDLRAVLDQSRQEPK